MHGKINCITVNFEKIQHSIVLKIHDLSSRTSGGLHRGMMILGEIGLGLPTASLTIIFLGGLIKLAILTDSY